MWKLEERKKEMEEKDKTNESKSQRRKEWRCERIRNRERWQTIWLLQKNVHGEILKRFEDLFMFKKLKISLLIFS